MGRLYIRRNQEMHLISIIWHPSSSSSNTPQHLHHTASHCWCQAIHILQPLPSSLPPTLELPLQHQFFYPLLPTTWPWKFSFLFLMVISRPLSIFTICIYSSLLSFSDQPLHIGMPLSEHHLPSSICVHTINSICYCQLIKSNNSFSPSLSINSSVVFYPSALPHTLLSA